MSGRDDRSGHPSLAGLVDYWLHDSDAAATAAIDDHLMRCDDCGRRVDELAAIGDGIRGALRAGTVSTLASDAFARRLAGHGLRIREYRMAAGGSVACTVAPDDDLIVARLDASLAGVERLDVRIEVSLAPGEVEDLRDVPFDASAGTVLYLPRIDQIRRMPAHVAHVTLLAIGGNGGPREVGRYTFDHRPWPEHGADGEVAG